MRLTSLLIMAALVLTLGGAPGLAQQPAKDLIATATDAGTFTTFLKAVQESGLADTLKGQGPYTIFAPTDVAFTKLPAGTLDALMKDKQKLAAFVNAHVVQGKLMAADFTKMQTAKTVNGQELKFTVKDGATMVNEVKIIKTDVEASNGVIHVIDTVLQPK